jgi:hypothetical protein
MRTIERASHRFAKVSLVLYNSGINIIVKGIEFKESYVLKILS